MKVFILCLLVSAALCEDSAANKKDGVYHGSDYTPYGVHHGYTMKHTSDHGVYDDTDGHGRQHEFVVGSVGNSHAHTHGEGDETFSNDVTLEPVRVATPETLINDHTTVLQRPHVADVNHAPCACVGQVGCGCAGGLGRLKREAEDEETPETRSLGVWGQPLPGAIGGADPYASHDRDHEPGNLHHVNPMHEDAPAAFADGGVGNGHHGNHQNHVFHHHNTHSHHYETVVHRPDIRIKQPPHVIPRPDVVLPRPPLLIHRPPLVYHQSPIIIHKPDTVVHTEPIVVHPDHHTHTHEVGQNHFHDDDVHPNHLVGNGNGVDVSSDGAVPAVHAGYRKKRSLSKLIRQKRCNCDCQAAVYPPVTDGCNCAHQCAQVVQPADKVFHQGVEVIHRPDIIVHRPDIVVNRHPIVVHRPPIVVHKPDLIIKQAPVVFEHTSPTIHNNFEHHEDGVDHVTPGLRAGAVVGDQARAGALAANNNGGVVGLGGVNGVGAGVGVGVGANGGVGAGVGAGLNVGY